MSKKLLLSALAAVGVLGLSSAAFADAANFTTGQDVYVGIQGGIGDNHANDMNTSGYTLPGFPGQVVGPNGFATLGTPAIVVPGLSFDHTGFAGRIFAGYDFNQYLAVETGYTRFANTDVKADDVKISTLKTFGIDLLGKITVPVVDNFGLYAKAGPGYLDTKFFNGSTENVDLVYGVGAQYAIMPNLVADVSMLRYNGNHKVDSSKYQPNADLYSIGLAYKINI